MVAIFTMLVQRRQLDVASWHWPCTLCCLCLTGMDVLPSSSLSRHSICHRHGLIMVFIVPASLSSSSSLSSWSRHGLCPAIVIVVVAVAIVMQGQGQVASSYRRRVGAGVVIVNWHGHVGIHCRLRCACVETLMLTCCRGIGHACCTDDIVTWPIVRCAHLIQLVVVVFVVLVSSSLSSLLPSRWSWS